MKAMLTTNMQTEFPAVKVSSYDAKGVWEGYVQTRSEKPEEHTVLPPFTEESFPKSLARQIFIAPNGSDENGTGSIDAPFATLSRALACVADGKGGVIYLREGIYNGATLDERHSGESDAPLFIRAYGKEKVTFSCGKTFDPSLLVPVANAPFVTDAQREQLDRFTEGNSKNVYAIDLKALGFKEEEFEAYRSGEKSAPLYVGESSYIVARFPNKGENDPDRKIANGRIRTMNIEEGKLNVRRNGRVWWGASTLYDEHKDDIGSWEIYIDDTTYGERAAAYANPYQNLYLYGAVYEEWDIQNSNVCIKMEEGHHVMAHTGEVTKWGCKANGHTSFYFHNMLEDLDDHGEYLIDPYRMVCFIYGRPSAPLSIVPSTEPVIQLEKTKHTVISDVSFRFTNGAAVSLHETDCAFVQNCSFRALGKTALLLDGAHMSGALYNVFEGCHALRTTFDKSKMIPTCNIIQNNVFDNSIGNQSASCMVSLSGGYGDVFSHNLLNQCNMGVDNLFDVVIEYNECIHGNRFVRDNGPVYGGVSNRGMHIRYNNFHDLDYSRYGIYMDDMASGNYIYGNVIHYAEGAEGRCINLHNGAMTVVDGNICIGGTMGAQNAPNYAAYTVNGVRTGAGGLRQSWFAIANSFLYKQYHAGNAAVFEARYPLYAWINEINDRSVAKMNANPNWQLLHKFSPEEDDEIFTRMPANNIYINNVAYKNAKPYNIPEYARDTCIVHGNLSYMPTTDVGFVDEQARDFRLREDSVILKHNPDFVPPPVEKAGRTV